MIKSTPTPVQAHEVLGTSDVGVEISAFVGDITFNLSGFTSPGAHVILEGQGIFAETYANQYGEFFFLNSYAPLSPREACLTAIDTNGRLSNPQCLPAFAVNEHINIGPIILPPTVSASEGTLTVDDYGVLSGKAVPDSTVTVDLYTDTSDSKISLLTQANQDGDYSMTLPTENQSTLRAFTTNDHDGLTSDKSLTLTMDVEPAWSSQLQSSLAFGVSLLLVIACVLGFVLISKRAKRGSA